MEYFLQAEPKPCKIHLALSVADLHAPSSPHNNLLHPVWYQTQPWLYHNGKAGEEMGTLTSMMSALVRLS